MNIFACYLTFFRFSMKPLFTLPICCLACTFMLGSSAYAQSPTVLYPGLSPARNAVAASRTVPVVVPFSQAINPATAGNVKVFSSKYRGRRTATASTSGSSVMLTPTAPGGQVADFRPGETVFVSVPATVQSSTGSSAVPQVYQFTAAAQGGSGVFMPGSEVPVGGIPQVITPQRVMLGDVDGDGDLDLLTANVSSFAIYNNTVSVRLNDGSGRFSGTTQVIVGTGPQSLALGDVDGDGDLDLLTANNSNRASVTPGTVSICLNDGSGTFAAATNLSVGNNPNAVALGDVDGDGDLDFVTSNYSGGSSGLVYVRLNDGSGNFSGSFSVSVNYSGYDLKLGDIDGDGDLDVLVAHTIRGGLVTVLLNNGQGSFASPQPVPADEYPTSVAADDIDGDGDLDLLIANNATSTGSSVSSVSVRLNNGSGSFSGTTNLGISRSPMSMRVGDVDGDGDLDILTIHYVYNANGIIEVMLNNGSGDFTAHSTVSIGPDPADLALGDLDGDGDLDVVAVNKVVSTVSVRLNAPAGTLATAAPLNAAQVVLYPNPAAKSAGVLVALAVAAGTREARATVHNALGQVVATALLPVQAGEATGTLPTAGLAAGVYLVRLTTGTASISKRLVVE
jgi:hypothetical protein